MKKRIICLFGVILLLCSSFTVKADKYMDEWEERKLLPVASNQIEGWPEGPLIGAQSAIVMEMNTHTILYAKNIDDRLYPASTTKILTCLLASKYCDLNDIVEFSYDAVHNVPVDGSNMGMDAGECLTLEQAMYGVLVGSANEAASAVGEHVAKTLGMEPTEKNFTRLMNEYSMSIGCTNSNFVNANGLYDDNHYTTVYDLALIGSEFFKNEMLCKMSSQSRYYIAPTDKQPDEITLVTKNQLYKGKPYEYPYLLGSKTGFVSQARQTLVSAAEKDGIKLVCVVFMEETPYQYADTISLFNYGFDNFKKFNISECETKYAISNNDIFDTENDILGNSSSLLSLDKEAYVILPKNCDFSEAVSKINYSYDDTSNIVASIDYTYKDINVGSCNIMFCKSKDDINHSSFLQTNSSTVLSNNSNDNNTTNIYFLNVKTLIIYIVLGFIAVLLLMMLFSFLKSFNFVPRNTEDIKRRRKRNREIRRDKRIVKKNLKKLNKLHRQKRNAYKKRSK